MALRPRESRPVPGYDEEYCADPPRGRRIGISLSGGGVRSAAFNLGALQALQEERVLSSAEYVAAVSGGNYIASALTISHAYAEPGAEDAHPLWAHGSPEERLLRRNTNYLAPGFAGRVWMTMNVLHGFVLNYLPFLLGGFIAGRVLGWLAYAARIRLTDPPLWTVVVPLAVVALFVLGAVGVVALARHRDGRHGVREYGDSNLERWAAGCIRLAALALVLLALPLLAGVYGVASRAVLAALIGPTDFDAPLARLAVAGGAILVALALTVLVVRLARRPRMRWVMLVAAVLASAALLLVPLLTSLEYAARHGVGSAADVLVASAALVVLVFMAVKVHNRRYSMHLFYRERLNSAFAVRRRRDENGRPVAEPVPYTQRLPFSEVGDRLSERGAQIPKLIVCCAVNVTSSEVPVGRFAESFTFTHDRTGGPRFTYQDTTRFEESRGPKGTDLTLPSIMAVSGAALSPLMGRFTYPPLRLLMALTNVRLGVWVRNPRHPSWDAPASAPKGRLGRFTAAIVEGWREPGALYVLREAIGGLTLKHRYIYLTDGGHWENLGLVELLRRRCTDVLCFDVSTDARGEAGDIGRAIALARSELGADIVLDPAPTQPFDGIHSADLGVRGDIHYPDGRQARLVYAKATLTEALSWDLRSFRHRDARFPHHSVARQIFTDELFEAYRSLGHAAGRRAVQLLNLPTSQLRSPAAAATNGRAPTKVPDSVP
ncbi:MAG TPA: hypothetical protein VGE11_00620 [Pseudonocardia sp.]